MDSSGASLWRTYYGGSNVDELTSVSLDSNGNLAAAGYTASTTNIASPNSYKNSFSGGSYDGFLAMFDTNGVRKWATYFGSTGAEILKATAAKNGQIVIAGNTSSTSNITTNNAHQAAFVGSNINGFVAAFDTSGAIEWSSYYGGDSTFIEGCEYDRLGNIIIAGGTKSTTNIATSSTHQPTKSGAVDCFAAKLDDAGNLIWGTYYGDVGNDYFQGLTLSNNEIHLAGASNSTVNITTPNSYNPTYQSVYVSYNTISNAFFTSLDFNGQRNYGSYINVGRNCSSVAVDNAGNLFFSGTRNQCYVCPLTYLVKLDYCNTAKPSINTSSLNFCPNSTTTLSTAPVSGNSYQWFRNGVAITGATNSFYSATQPGDYYVVANNCPSGHSDTLQLVAYPMPVTNISKLDVPCYNASIAYVVVNVSGGTPPYFYTWDNSANTTNVLSGLNIGRYISHVTDMKGCIKSDTTDIIRKIKATPSSPFAEICAVTVDSVTGKNLIIWEKNGDVRAKDYNIYVEGVTAGTYNYLGTNSVSQLSTYLDNVSNPLQQSYSYKISEVDSCSYSRPLVFENYHKTIHLTANKGINGEVNLNWNNYEGKPYSTHYIMRSFNGGAFTLLNQVSSAITSYSDLTPPNGALVYRIDIDLPTACNPQKATSYSRISSNNVNLGTSSARNLYNETVQVIPNPTSGYIHINGKQPAIVRMYDPVGKLVLETKSTYHIDLSMLPFSTYLIKLYDENGQLYHQQKIIKK